MKTWRIASSLVLAGLISGCVGRTPSPHSTIAPSQNYIEKRAEYKAFLRDHVSLGDARQAVLDAVRLTKSIDGITVPKEKVFESWNLHLESPGQAIEAEEWIVATSESGGTLVGLMFSLGFDRRTMRFERGGPWMINFTFRFQIENGRSRLVFERADVSDERNLILSP